MNRFSKRINPSFRREIDIIKSDIKSSTTGFDGCGYPFKKALSEVRKEGYLVKYVKEKCHYILIK
jgi:hypothetical protein